LSQDELFVYYDIDGEKQQIFLGAGQLGFTFCKVPVIYKSGETSQIVIALKNGKTKVIPNNIIDGEISALIFNRGGEVERIELSITKN